MAQSLFIFFDSSSTLVMELRLLIKQSLLPPGCILWLLLLAFLLRKRWPRTALAVFVSAMLALLLVSMPVSTQYLAAMIETEPALEPQQWPHLAERTDAIVILGGGREGLDPAWGEEQVSYMAMERIRYGARLAKASGLPILFSGGIVHQDATSEAALMANTLEKDFALTAKWLEEESRTTWENALLSQKTLKAAGIQRIVLVTNAWHMPRAKWSYEQQGFQVLVAPVGFFSAPRQLPLAGMVPNSKSVWQNTLLLHELLALYSYQRLYLSNTTHQ